MDASSLVPDAIRGRLVGLVRHVGGRESADHAPEGMVVGARVILNVYSSWRYRVAAASVRRKRMGEG